MNNTDYLASTLLMVRPVAFECNSQTARSNVFQHVGNEKNIQAQAQAEFDAYVKRLKENRINVITVEDSYVPHTPDSVFPNNWFSTHEDGSLVLYPMFAENRQKERKSAVLEAIRSCFKVSRTVDLTIYEKEGYFLEGTGSMVLDRTNKLVYACRSIRTSEYVLDVFCKTLGYSPIVFNAVDRSGNQIYHTNVLMNVGSETAVICMDSIQDKTERRIVEHSLEQSGKKIIEISMEQMKHFAGNMLEVKNNQEELCLIMSRTAYNSLTKYQIDFFTENFRLIIPDLKCIEYNGGGSARCMVAEIF